MSNLFRQSVEKIIERYNNLERILSEGFNDKNFASNSKEHADLTAVYIAINEFIKIENDLASAREMLQDSDIELRKIAQEEVFLLEGLIEKKTYEAKLLMLRKDKDCNKNAILEIRVGTGGDEAALFAADLMRMYQRFSDIKKWEFDILSENWTELNGIKECVINIKGKSAYARLKYESGVHRVQRVPSTEASGRLHTSAATVAVLPEAEEVDIEVNESDLRIDTYRASGAGGQHVNKTDSAIRITHIPTGIVVQQQDERSQHKNKARAMKILRAKIYEAEAIKQESERAEKRKSQVGSGDRSERIRTYNFPQNRITDHRVNLTLYKLDRIMEGFDIDEIIDAMIHYEENQRLSELESLNG
jgi:peptide chain release factor 1